MMRSRLGWFVKGVPHSSRFRASIKHVSSRREAFALIEDFRGMSENAEAAACA
jgi:hypothetical protein